MAPGNHKMVCVSALLTLTLMHPMREVLSLFQFCR